MVDYWEQWEKQGEDWKTIFKELKPHFRLFAEKYNLQILPWRWEEPSIGLRQYKEGVYKDIHNVIQGEPGKYSLRLRASAWLDVQEGNRRFRRYRPTEDFGEIPIGDVSQINQAIPQLCKILEEILSKMATCSEEKLEKKVAL